MARSQPTKALFSALVQLLSTNAVRIENLASQAKHSSEMKERVTLSCNASVS